MQHQQREQAMRVLVVASSSAAVPPSPTPPVDGSSSTLQLLRGCGYAVETAQPGEAVARASRPGTFDLLLVDLPGPPPLSLLRALAPASPPLVVVLGEQEEGSAFEALAAGAAGVLSRPLRRQEVSNLWMHVWRWAPGVSTWQWDLPWGVCVWGGGGGSHLPVCGRPDSTAWLCWAVGPSICSAPPRSSAPLLT